MKKLLNKLTTWFNNIFKEPKEKFELQEKFKAKYDSDKEYYDSWNIRTVYENIDEYHRVIDNLAKSKKYYQPLRKDTPLKKLYNIGWLPPIDSQTK